MTVFGWELDEIERFYFSGAIDSPASIFHTIAFNSCNVMACEELGVPFTILGRAYLESMRSLPKGLPGADAIPSIFEDLRSSILEQNLSRAKFVGLLISNIACNAVVANDTETLSCLIINFSRSLQEIFAEEKFVDTIPIIFEVDSFSLSLTKEAFSVDIGSLFIGVALRLIYESYGKYAFNNISELNSSYRAVVERLSVTSGHDLLNLEEGDARPYKKLLLSFFGLWHFYSLGDKTRCFKLLKEVSVKFASGEMEYSKVLEALGVDDDRYAKSLSDVIETKDEIAIAIGVSLTILRDEMFVSSKLATPKDVSIDILDIISRALGRNILDIMSMAFERAGAWASSKPLSLVNIKPIKFIIGSSLKLIASSQNVALLVDAVSGLYAFMSSLYRAGEIEAVTKLLSDVPFDYKCKILESLKLDDRQECLKSMADAAILESIKDDISKYDLLVEEHGVHDSYKGKLKEYHDSVMAFNREVYTAVGLPQACDLADVYVSHGSMCKQQMRIVEFEISSVTKASLEDVGAHFEKVISADACLSDFMKASASIKKLLNHLISRGQTEEYVALLGQVRERVMALLSSNLYDRAVMFVSILQLNEHGYEDPLMELTYVVEHSLDALKADPNQFFMMMVAYNEETYYTAPGGHLTASMGIRSYKQKALGLLGVTSACVDFTRKSAVKRYLDVLCADTEDAEVLAINAARIRLLFRVLYLYTLESNQASVSSAAFQYVLEKNARVTSTVRELRVMDSFELTSLPGLGRSVLETPRGRQLALASSVFSFRFSNMAFKLGVREGEEIRDFRRNFLGRMFPRVDGLISDLESSSALSAEGVTVEDYMRFGFIQSAALSAYMLADGPGLAEIASGCTPILQRLNKEGNYHVLSLLSGTFGKSLENLIVALQSGRANLVYFYLFQIADDCSAAYSFASIDEVKSYAIAFAEEAEDLGRGCDLLPLDELERELVGIKDLSASPAKAIILEARVRLNQALLEQNIEYYARILNILKDVLLARAEFLDLSSELLILNILELRPEQAHGLFLNIQARDEHEIIRKLHNIFLKNIVTAKYGSIVGVAQRKIKQEEFTKDVLSHMGITIVDISQPFRLVSNAALLDGAVKEIAKYIRTQANKGVCLSTFEDVAVAAKLESLVLALAEPEDSDTDGYREIYLSLNRAYLDHVLAHRFGIGGRAELNGLEYDLDVSYTHTMVWEMQKGYKLMQEAAVFARGELDEFWDAIAVADDAEQHRVINEIFTDIKGIELQEWVESSYREAIEAGKPVALPTYTSFGEEGGHANGCVIFKKGSEHFAIFSDRGGDVEFKDCGINIYRVGNVYLLKDFAKRLSESNKNLIPNEEFKSLKDSLGLDKLHMIEKKPHKSGTCAYSSSAKAIAQGIQYARFYCLAVDHGVESGAAHILAGKASTVLAKKFSLFDRREYLGKYIAECRRLVVKPNVELLSRIRLSCGDKDKYRGIAAIIDDLSILDGTHIETAEIELKQRVRRSILIHLEQSQVAISMEVGFVDTLVDEIVTMYTKGYTRAQVIEHYDRFVATLKAREEAASLSAVDGGSPVRGTGATAPRGEDEEEIDRERVVVDGARAQSP